MTNLEYTQLPLFPPELTPKKRRGYSPNDPRRKTAADYHALASQKGFTWLETEIVNSHTKTRWRCSKNHEWEAEYARIKHSTGCPQCAIERNADARRKTPDDYEALAASKGFTWTGEYPRRTDEPTEWICSLGHIWRAIYQSVKQTGCPVCAGNIRKSPADYHALAQSRGFQWIGTEALNAQTKTLWRCQNGHEWEATYGNIRAGHGCLKCIRPSKTPEEILEYKRKWGQVDHTANPDKYRHRRRQWRKNNPHSTWQENHRRLTLQRGLPYKFGLKDRKRMMDYWQGSCAISGEQGKLHIDHWIPLASPDCPGTVATNMIPMLERLNTSKQDKDPHCWLIETFGDKHAAEILARIETYFEWVRQQSEGVL